MSWNWPEIDKKKVERARSVKILTLDKENCTLECIGSGGEIYQVSLSSCTCTDFARKHDACKHMIRLAMELGILNESGNTMEQQREVDLFIAKHDLAYWFGCYYLFNSPVVSDDEYDALKRKLKDEYGVSFPEYSNVQNDSFAAVRIFLDSHNYEYIDKTAQGGSLYVFDEKAANEIKAMGLNVLFASEGTRSTRHRPAWYLKHSESQHIYALQDTIEGLRAAIEDLKSENVILKKALSIINPSGALEEADIVNDDDREDNANIGIAGRKFAFCGRMKTVTHNHAAGEVTKFGGERASVNNADMLIVGEHPPKGKVLAAAKSGVKMISEEEFNAMLKEQKNRLI